MQYGLILLNDLKRIGHVVASVQSQDAIAILRCSLAITKPEIRFKGKTVAKLFFIYRSKFAVAIIDLLL